MTLPVIVLPKAEAAIAAAIDHYESLRPGHGELFRLEVDRVLGVVARWPESYERATPRLRRAPIRHFSELVIYHSLPTIIHVVGVISARRDPSVFGSLDPS
jgi:hypothetical protein